LTNDTVNGNTTTADGGGINNGGIAQLSLGDATGRLKSAAAGCRYDPGARKDSG